MPFMKIKSQAVKILSDAEQSLAQLAARASTDRDYDLAGALLATAQQLAKSAERFAVSSPSSHTVPTTTPSADDEDKQSKFPRFERQSDWLVKIANSRKAGAQYEHKCPLPIVRAVASAAVKAGSSGRQFSIDKLAPITDPSTGNEVPTYQIYLSLVFFRSLGLIQKHGRARYSLIAGKDPVSSLDASFNSLPTR